MQIILNIFIYCLLPKTCDSHSHTDHMAGRRQQVMNSIEISHLHQHFNRNIKEYSRAFSSGNTV